MSPMKLTGRLAAHYMHAEGDASHLLRGTALMRHSADIESELKRLRHLYSNALHDRPKRHIAVRDSLQHCTLQGSVITITWPWSP